MKKVIFVDDDKAYRRMFKLIADEQHVKLDAFGNPDEAFAMILNESYDAVFLDQRLAWSSGTELAQQIKERKPHLPIYIVTSFPEDYVRAQVKIKKGVIEGVINKAGFIDKIEEILKVVADD